MISSFYGETEFFPDDLHSFLTTNEKANEMIPNATLMPIIAQIGKKRPFFFSGFCIVEVVDNDDLFDWVVKTLVETFFEVVVKLLFKVVNPVFSEVVRSGKEMFSMNSLVVVK